MKEEIRPPREPGQQDVEIERIAVDPNSQQHERHDVERGTVSRLKGRVALAFLEDPKTEIHDDEDQTYIEVTSPLWRRNIRCAGV